MDTQTKTNTNIYTHTRRRKEKERQRKPWSYEPLLTTYPDFFVINLHIVSWKNFLDQAIHPVPPSFLLLLCEVQSPQLSLLLMLCVDFPPLHAVVPVQLQPQPLLPSVVPAVLVLLLQQPSVHLTLFWQQFLLLLDENKPIACNANKSIPRKKEQRNNEASKEKQQSAVEQQHRLTRSSMMRIELYTTKYKPHWLHLLLLSASSVSITKIASKQRKKST